MYPVLSGRLRILTFHSTRTQDDKGRDLVNITEAALEAGIAACGPGRHFRDIGRAIHGLLRGRDYSISPMFTGHGIGREFHRRPWIIHDCTCDGSGAVLR